jgi:hypothetical protein
MPFFIVTAVKTSNITYPKFNFYYSILRWNSFIHHCPIWSDVIRMATHGHPTGNGIYWNHTDPRIQVIITVLLVLPIYSSLEHTLKNSQLVVSAPVINSRCLVAATNGRHFPSSRFQKCPWTQPTSTNNSLPRLNCSTALTYQSTNQLKGINSLSHLSCI